MVDGQSWVLLNTGMAASIDELNLELGILRESISLTFESQTVNDRLNEWRKKVTACNFALLLRLANHHGLVPWLAYCLESELSSTGRFADNGLSELYKLNQMLRFNSEYQTKAAVFISEQLGDRQLAHVVFKGSALLHQIYPEYLLSRTSDDLDILVAPTALGEAVSTLETLGYKTQKLDAIDSRTFTKFIARHSKWFRFRDLALLRTERVPHHIDLHWHIADEFSFSAGTEALLADWEAVATAFGEIRSLPLHKHFVYLCSHGYSDYYFRLRYLADVYSAMRHNEFNIQRALAFAEDCGVSNQVEQSMRLADCFLGASDGHEPTVNHTDKYTEIIIQRLLDSNGLTARIHPNRGRWTRVDKNEYLMRQIRNRSAKSYWFSPIVARTKLVPSDLKDWQDGAGPVFWFYLSCLFKKLFIKNK